LNYARAGPQAKLRHPIKSGGPVWTAVPGGRGGALTETGSAESKQQAGGGAIAGSGALSGHTYY